VCLIVPQGNYGGGEKGTGILGIFQEKGAFLLTHINCDRLGERGNRFHMEKVNVTGMQVSVPPERAQTAWK